MKHIALAGLFALVAPAVAQKGESAGPKWSKEARLEVAKAIAAEEQENDLDKAQQLYRAAMEDAERGAEAKSLAAYRLAALLRRLGKVDEAKAVLKQGGKGQVVSLDDVTSGRVGQDRVKELRLQARKLVKKIVRGYAGGRLIHSERLTGVAVADSDQLFWIGDPAVVEVVAYLQTQLKQPYGGTTRDQVGLFEFLWIRGGPVASRFLLEALGNDAVALTVARAAHRAERFDLQTPLLRAILEHEHWPVIRTFLVGTGNAEVGMVNPGGCVRRLETDQLLKICEDGSSKTRAVVLTWFRGRQMDALQMKRMHALVRDALRGSDPVLGKEAEKLLASTTSQQSIEGLTLLLEKLPNLVERMVRVESLQTGDKTPAFEPAEARALVPALDAAAAAIDPKLTPNDAHRGAVFWMNWLMRYLVQTKEERALQSALGWLDQGYDVSDVLFYNGSSATSLALLERAPAMSEKDRTKTLLNLRGSRLTTEALEPLLALAPKNPADSIRDWRQVGILAGGIGTDDAVDWIMRQWRDSKVRAPAEASEQTRWVVWALIEAGRKGQSERLRSAMRDVLRGFGGPKFSDKDLGPLMLALMSMGDQGALDLLGAGVGVKLASTHPYRTDGKSKPVYKPHAYLLYNGDPAHPYTEQQIAAVVGQIGQLDESVTFLGVGDPKQVPDSLLTVLAEHDTSSWDGRSWVDEVVARLSVRLHDGADLGSIEPWFLEQLGRESRLSRWMYLLPARLVVRYRERIALLLDGDDESWAEAACVRLWRHDRGIDVLAALENKHSLVRQWAIERLQEDRMPVDDALLIARLADEEPRIRQTAAVMLGAKVSKAAVPQLIACLKDPEKGVQEAASKALTRVRFYHEQKAHWDRILKGMDASPASAVEKLLLQAKPGQKKEQRLLAITSLGVLGKAEALPFLIEWTQESDAPIAEAAKAAVQKIHLDPRK